MPKSNFYHAIDDGYLSVYDMEKIIRELEEDQITFRSLCVWSEGEARLNMRGTAYILSLDECISLRDALDDVIIFLQSGVYQHAAQP